jgi:formylglycine-generating enzyme required for sulfatase activity
VYLAPYALADRLVTNAEYLDFINAGGYQRADLWLSEAWAELQREPRHHPLYWNWEDGQWFEYRLDGYYPLVLNAPVVHISGYEAAAFAAWSDARLPTEFEWEHAASMLAPQLGNFVESQQLHPLPQQGGYNQMFGDVWEWTSSSYGPYPGLLSFARCLG